MESDSIAFFAALTRPKTNALEHRDRNSKAKEGRKDSRGLRSPPSSQNSLKSHESPQPAEDHCSAVYDTSGQEPTYSSSRPRRRMSHESSRTKRTRPTMRIVTKVTTNRDGAPSQTTTGLRTMPCLLTDKATTKSPVQVPIAIRKTNNGIKSGAVDLDGRRGAEERGLLEEDHGVIGVGSQMHIALTDSSPRHQVFIPVERTGPQQPALSHRPPPSRRHATARSLSSNQRSRHWNRMLSPASIPRHLLLHLLPTQAPANRNTHVRTPITPAQPHRHPGTRRLHIS